MSTKLKCFALYWLPLILYCVLIYIQSAYPSPEQIPSFRFVDKMLHLGAYAIMGILFYRAYRTLKIRDNLQLLMMLSVVSASLYGVSDEIHQSFVPFRSAEVADAIADFCGAVCGVYLYCFLVGFWMNRRQKLGIGG
jgi:VanZ family protein